MQRYPLVASMHGCQSFGGETSADDIYQRMLDRHLLGQR